MTRRLPGWYAVALSRLRLAASPRPPVMHLLALFPAAIALAGPAAGQNVPACPPPAEQRVVAELFFGRNIGEVVGVSEDAWARFVDTEITPRFPEGLTVIDLAGQWREPGSGRIVREPGKQLIIVLGNDPSVQSRLREVIEAYKRTFRQDSVLMLQRPVCATF